MSSPLPRSRKTSARCYVGACGLIILFLLIGLIPPSTGVQVLGAHQNPAAGRSLAWQSATPAMPWYLVWLDWIAGPAQAGQAGIDWDIVNTSLITAVPWNVIAYGNGRFVALPYVTSSTAPWG